MSYPLFLIILLFLACNQPDQGIKTYGDIPYTLDSYDLVHKLPSSLREISGLTTGKGDILYTLNDEEGKIFTVDRITGNILDVNNFKRAGDYEGLELVNEKMWVINSNCDLFEVNMAQDGTEFEEEYNTPLKGFNDCEGLGYYKPGHRLLIACKERAGVTNKYDNKRGVYAFDIEDKKMDKEPFLLLDLDKIEIIDDKAGNDHLGRRFFDSDFKPSGIAVHPLSGDIYILASVGHALLRVSPSGKILGYSTVNGRYLPKPEGICFTSEGDMYISSEAEGGSPRLILYRYKP